MQSSPKTVRHQPVLVQPVLNMDELNDSGDDLILSQALDLFETFECGIISEEDILLTQYEYLLA